MKDEPLELPGGGEGGKGGDCGPPPQIPENPTEEDAKNLFHAIAGDDGEIDGGEAEAALRCAVEWGFLSEDEAKEIYKAGEIAAGDDGKLSMEEAEAAFAADVAK